MNRSRPTLKELGVEIDGAHRFGDSCIAGTGIPTSAIGDRFKAGDSLASLVDDFQITQEQAEAAVRFEFFRHRFKREFKRAEIECKEIWGLIKKGDAADVIANLGTAKVRRAK